MRTVSRHKWRPYNFRLRRVRIYAHQPVAINGDPTISVGCAFMRTATSSPQLRPGRVCRLLAALDVLLHIFFGHQLERDPHVKPLSPLISFCATSTEVFDRWRPEHCHLHLILRQSLQASGVASCRPPALPAPHQSPSHRYWPRRYRSLHRCQSS